MDRKCVLFLCTGNYYRSRFAEAMFNHLTEQSRLPWFADSRGLALERGIHNVGPMAPEAVERLHRLGVDLGPACTRMPRALSAADLDKANRIVALKRDEHYPLIVERFSNWVNRVEYWHIEDEPGVLPLIERAVRDLLGRLQDRADS